MNFTHDKLSDVTTVNFTHDKLSDVNPGKLLLIKKGTYPKDEVEIRTKKERT